MYIDIASTKTLSPGPLFLSLHVSLPPSPFLVATKMGNTLLDLYHWGAYGSKATGQWSCCNEKRKDALGCRNVGTTLTRNSSNVSQASVRSNDTWNSDVNSSTSSIRNSSSCSSGVSNYSS